MAQGQHTDEVKQKRRNREAELSPLVSSWLRAAGYSVYAEIHAMGTIDHVGIRWADEAIATVELKCSLTAKVIYQAHLNQLVTVDSWVAVGTRPKKSSLQECAKMGLGVWAAGEVLLQPSHQLRHVSETYRRLVLDSCRNRPEGGIGGLPTLKGDGPAIRCRAATVAYLTTNRKASWQDIWRDVPNHYAHYRSMRGAIGPREILLHEADLLNLCEFARG